MDITAAEWNQRFPVGTPVRYHPIIGDSGLYREACSPGAQATG